MPIAIQHKRKIWGIEFEELFDGSFLIWRAKIRNPFFSDGWRIGINEKFLREATKIGVDKFIFQIGQQDVMMPVPNRKELEKKDKAGEFEMRPSMFEKSPAMKIYYFKI